MTTANPQPNEHAVQQHQQHDLKRSACAALPSSPPSSPAATSDHAFRGDDDQGKGVRDDSVRSASSGETAVNADTPTAAAPGSVPATSVPFDSEPTESRQADVRDQTSSAAAVSSNLVQSSNARDNANVHTAPTAIDRAKHAHARSASANAAPSLAHVTKSAEPPASSSSVLPTPPGSAMPSPPILVRGASRLSAQASADCVRQEQSGGGGDQAGQAEDKAGRIHDGARGQSGAAPPGQASARIEPVPAEQDQEQVPELKSWSSPCADRFVLVVGPSKAARKLNRTVSWHETVKTPGRVPPSAAASSALLADQDPAPTAPPMYLELDLESTPLARTDTRAPAPAPAAPAPAPASQLARAAPLKASSKRKRSRSPSPPALSQSTVAAASSSSHAPLAYVPRPHVHAAGPRRVHTLPAPPSALTVSPTKALEWLQWAEDKENIKPETWLRQYEVKKKDPRPGNDEEQQGKGMAACGGGAGAGGYGGGSAGGAAGAVTGGPDRRSRNSAPSSSSSLSSSTTLSTLASRSINASVDPHTAKCDHPPTKRLRTGYATSAAAASGSSSSSSSASSTLVSLCLASSPMRPASSPPASASCRGSASTWLARRPVDVGMATAAEGGQSSPVAAAALMMRSRNSRAVIR